MRKCQMIHSFFLIGTIFILLTECVCDKPVEPKDDGEIPIANAGPDSSSRVGTYYILDGSASDPGEGETITWWEWKDYYKNPKDIWFPAIGGEDYAFKKIGFTVPGEYRFLLRIRNEHYESAWDTVVIQVAPRDQIVFEDPSLEIHMRWCAKYPDGELTESVLQEMDSLLCAELIVDEVTNLVGLERCTNMYYCDLTSMPIADLSPLASLKKLRYLNLSQCPNIVDISPISGLTELIWLGLDNLQISDITPLSNLTKLRQLNISFDDNLVDISSLANLVNLEGLLMGGGLIGNQLEYLTPMKRLKALWFANGGVSDVSPLAELDSLVYLALRGHEFEDITSLGKFTNLFKIQITRTKVKDISVLEKLERCIEFNLALNQIEDLSPLVNNKGMYGFHVIAIWGNPLNEKSVNEYIPELRRRGVTVIADDSES